VKEGWGGGGKRTFNTLAAKFMHIKPHNIQNTKYKELKLSYSGYVKSKLRRGDFSIAYLL
jgi:hypothetical protein